MNQNKKEDIMMMKILMNSIMKKIIMKNIKKSIILIQFMIPDIKEMKNLTEILSK